MRPVIFTALRGARKAYPICLIPAHCVYVNFADVPNSQGREYLGCPYQRCGLSQLLSLCCLELPSVPMLDEG